jgi:rubredoxin
MKPNEFECAACHNIYDKGWSDDEAKAEATEIFGKNPDEWNEPQVLVCDDCFEKMNPANHPELVEQMKQII